MGLSLCSKLAHDLAGLLTKSSDEADADLRARGVFAQPIGFGSSSPRSSSPFLWRFVSLRFLARRRSVMRSGGKARVGQFGRCAPEPSRQVHPSVFRACADAEASCSPASMHPNPTQPASL